jgi:hypothetical protein
MTDKKAVRTAKPAYPTARGGRNQPLTDVEIDDDEFVDDIKKELSTVPEYFYETSGIDPMRIASEFELIMRQCENVPSYQFLRELVQNAMEAGATYIDITPWWLDVEQFGIYRLAVIDNGSGMTAEELSKYINGYSSSGKNLSVFGGHYGIGAKLSCLAWNKFGILYMTWKKGVGSAICLCVDEETGEIGAKRFLYDEDIGDEDGRTASLQTAIFEPTPECKPSLIEDQGTVVVLYGNTGKEHTWLGPQLKPGKYALSKMYSRLKQLNKRYWTIPKDIAVSVYSMKAKKKDWPKNREEAFSKIKEGPDRTHWRRKVKGMDYIVDGRAEQRGTLVSDSFRIHWAWLKEETTSISYYPQGGFIATLYQNELYDMRDTSAKSIYNKFGLYRRIVNKRVVLVIEPIRIHPIHSDGIRTDDLRTRLIQPSLKDNDPANQLPWDMYGEFFRENMPEIIKQAMDDISTTDEDLTKNVQETLKKYLHLYKRPRIKPFKNEDKDKDKEKVTYNEDEPGGYDLIGDEGDDPPPIRGKKKRRKRTRIKPVKRGGESKGVLVNKGSSPYPDFEWIKGKDEGLEGRLASYDWINNKLLLNEDYSVVRTEIQTRTEARPESSEEIDKIIEGGVKRAYVEHLSAIIMHHKARQDTREWTSQQWEVAFSPEALTIAASGFRWSDNIINRYIGAEISNVKKKSKEN